MNKRIRKKLTRLPNDKCKAVVTVDLSNVTPNSHIDVYIPKRFETTDKNDCCMKNDVQGKMFSTRKLQAKGFDCYVYLKSKEKFDGSLTVWVADTERSSYVIISSKAEKD